MKIDCSLCLLCCSSTALALAAPSRKLADFELTDQDARLRSYRFPKAKVTVMTVADHKGSDQLAPWIQRCTIATENASTSMASPTSR